MIQIRPATLADLEILHANNMMLALESENKVLDPDTLRKGLTALLHDANKGRYLVAEDDGMVIGQVMVTVEWSDWRNGPMWWFQSVFIQPHYRRLGVFTMLFRHVVELAKAHEVKELRLYVDKGNGKAVQTYSALGMREANYRMLELGL